MNMVRYKLANGEYQQLWSNVGTLTTNDDWSLIESVVGYLGSGLTTTPGIDPRTLTAPDSSPVIDLIVGPNDPEDPVLGATGGVAIFNASSNHMIALGASDTADAPYIVFYLDSTDRKDVEISFLARDLENTATSDSNATPIAVQYRTSPTGNWINAAGGYLPDATLSPQVPNDGLLSISSTLGADADNCPTLEIRIITTNSPGNDEWVGIDDIHIRSDPVTAPPPPPQGQLVINDVGDIIEGNAGFTAAVFTITRVGGSQGAVSVQYRMATPDLLNGVGSSDFEPGTSFNGTLNFADGETTKTLVFNIKGDTGFELDENFFLALFNPTGGVLLPTSGGHGTIINDDVDLKVSVNDVTVNEGTGGTATVTFTVTRPSSNQTQDAFDVDYATADGSAQAGSDYVATSGTLHFAENQNSATVTVTVNSDALAEADETFFLNLSNLSIGVITDAQGRATINNDDFQTLTGTPGADIMDGFGSANILVGLAGNDTYFVDDDEDAVVEAVGGGFDAVYSSDNYVLGSGVEVEWLSTIANYATTALNLTGNEFGQYLIGNEGTNMLDGGAGADIMFGLGGDDTYFVDDAGDIVNEGAGGGHDAIVASISLALAAGLEIEELRTPDSAATLNLNFSGNEFDQILRGDTGQNLLNGGGGADQLYGGRGNDIYFVDSADTVIEENSQGSDAVYASGSFTLSFHTFVEWLSAADVGATTALNLTGNDLQQYLLGNAGGSDVLVGYGGVDTFQFTSALETSPVGPGNLDTIVDFVSGTDKIALDDAVFAAIGSLGALAPGAFVTGTAAGDADDRIIYDSATGQIFYDADGSGSGHAIWFATLQSAPALAASDIIVI
jgi:Ca2+-binding RTX toxin-like protein